MAADDTTNTAALSFEHSGVRSLSDIVLGIPLQRQLSWRQADPPPSRAFDGPEREAYTHIHIHNIYIMHRYIYRITYRYMNTNKYSISNRNKMPNSSTCYY